MNTQAGENSYAQQVSHNLRQLQGWLEAWSAGRPLSGSNDWGEFALDWTDVDWVVLISVVQGPDSTAEFHHLSTEDLAVRYPKVAAVVSVPEAVLMDLVQWGGTALDLADYLLRLAELPPIPEGLARAVLAEQNRSVIPHVPIDEGEAADSNDEVETISSEVLLSGLHSMSRSAVPAPGAPPIARPAAVFNDLGWADNAKVMATISDVTALLRAGSFGPDVAGAELALDTYLFLILAAELDKPDELRQAIATYHADHPAAQPVIITAVMSGRAVLEGHSPTMVLPDVLPPSAVGRLLSGPMLEARR